jgi:hypothetical protein
VLVTASIIGETSSTDRKRIELVDCQACSLTTNTFPAGTTYNYDVHLSGSESEGNFVDSNGSVPAGQLILKDEFATGTTSSGAIGDLGWTLGHGASPANPSVAIETATGDHPGVITVTCDAANTGTSGMILQGTAGKMIDPDDMFEVIFLVKFNTNTSVFYSLGLSGSAASTFTPSNGICFQTYDLGGGTLRWVGKTIKAGTPSTTADFSAPDTSWHRFRIRRIDTTTIGFSMDGGPEKVITTNIPDTGILNPYIVFSNGSAAGKDFTLDYFELSRTRKDDL